MKYILLLVPLFVIAFGITFGITDSYGIAPPPPTTFTVTLVDDSNKKIEAPAFLQVIETLNGQETSSYRIDVRSNPQTFPMAWYTPSRDANTEVHIFALKQGYEKSSEFVFTITDQTPKEGTLFEHTFTLNQKESSKASQSSHQVTKDGNSFTVNTTSTSDIQSIEFIEAENALLVILSGDALEGYTDFSIPNSLMKAPFTVLLNNQAVFPNEDRISQGTKLHVTYSNGQHNIRIISSETGAPTQFTTQDTQTTTPSGDGGCLIATATYGSELAPQVQQLRELRDGALLQTNSGSAFLTGFNQLYYSFSPTIADWERQSPVFKEAVKLTVTPMITSLSILNYVDLDSESKVLGYGISVILLNVGMYFVAPAIIIYKIKSKFR